MKCALLFAFLGSIGSESTIARMRAQEPVNPLADQSANLSEILPTHSKLQQRPGPVPSLLQDIGAPASRQKDHNGRIRGSG